MADIGVNLSVGGIEGLKEVAATLSATSKNMKDLLSNINGLSNALDGLNKKAGKSNDKFKPENLKMAANEVEKLKNNISLLEFKTKDTKISTDELIDTYYKIGEAKDELNKITNAYKNQQQQLKKNDVENKKIIANQEKTKVQYSQQIGLIDQLGNRMSLLKQKMMAATDPKEVKQLSAEIRRLATEKAKLTGGVTNLGKQSKLTMGIMGQFRGMVTNFIGAYAVFSGLKNIVNTVTEFESAMARVRAITGATEEEFRALSEIARRPSIKGSIFDPKTVADLQIELGKLGFTAREIGLAVVPIVNLATATGEDLANAAEISAATLRSFNLDATQMTRVIDVMAKSFTSSALDMRRWAEGAKYAAPVANQLKWSVENLGSVMAVLANRQIFGSLAGTSLRNIMSEIADTSSDLYKKLGLTSTSFEEFITKLGEANEKGIDFSDILELVPRRASTAFLVLSKGTQEIKEMNDALTLAAGSVEEMADIQLVTLKSRLNILTSTWKSFILEVDEGDSVLSRIAKGGIAALSDGISDLMYQMEYGSFGKAFLNWINPLGGGTWKNPLGFMYGDFVGISEEIRKISEEDVKQYNKSLNQFVQQLNRTDLNESLTQRRAFLQEQISSYQEIFKDSISLDGADAAKQKERAEQYIRILDKAFNVVAEGLSQQSEEYLQDRLQIIQKQVSVIEKNLEGNNLNEIQREQFNIKLKYLELEADEINKIIARNIKSEEDLEKEKTKALKNRIGLEYQIKKNAIEADLTLTESARKTALIKLKADYEVDLNNIEKQEEDKIHLAHLYNQLNKSIQERANAEIIALNEKDNEENIKQLYKNYQNISKEKKRIADLELKQEKINLKNLKNELAGLADNDEKGKIRLTSLILDQEYKIRLKEAENDISVFANNLQDILNVLGDAEGEERTWLLEVLGLTDEGIKQLEDQIKLAQENLKTIIPEIPKERKKTLASILGFEEDDFALIMQGVNEITSRISDMSNSVVASYQAMTEASQRRVEQLESELQTELQLAEQGFASNVTLKRKQLEEEKAIRDKNLEEQKKAQKKQLALQSTLDAANLVSTVIKLALTEVGTKGLAGIIAATVGAAGLFALVTNIKAKSKEITSYEKGGFEYLEGKSHRQGGISLGEGREAQGGEMLAVFNRRATSKYGGEIENFVNAINKDKLNIGSNAITDSKRNIIVNMDNSKLNDIHGVLKQVRDNNITYYGDYKVVKQGNRIRRVKINGV